MQRVSNYVGKQVYFAIAIILFGFVSLELMFRLIGEMKNVEGNYTIAKAIYFELLNTPEFIYDLMPMVGLIGCLAGLGSLAGTSELVVMRAAGVSIVRLVIMTFKPALVFLIIAMIIGEFVAPSATQYARAMRELALNDNYQVDVKNGLWLRDGDSFLFVNTASTSGFMQGVRIFEYVDQRLEKVIFAQSARYANHQWRLSKVKIITTSYQLDALDDAAAALSQANVDFSQLPLHLNIEQAAEIDWQSELAPDLLAISAIRPSRLKMQDLWRYSAYLKQQKLNSIEHDLAFWKKAYYPLIMLSLVLVGVSFVFGSLRESTMGYRLFIGIMTATLFKILQDSLNPITIIFQLQPVISMLIPAILSVLAGIFLLSRVR